MEIQKLIDLAITARERAYAPYSKHRVGAAVLTRDGKVFTGVNVENCVYPLTDCAERVAICKAVSEGATSLVKIAVVTGNQELSPPCGGCRQVMHEFNPSLEIIVANLRRESHVFNLKDLLPFAFGPHSLSKGQEL